VKIEGPCEVKIKVEGNISIEIIAVKKEELEEKPIQIVDKGKLLKQTRTIGIYENPLNEIKLVPLIKSNMYTILDNYYPGVQKKTLTTYINRYCEYLQDVEGLSYIKERRRPYKRYRRKHTDTNQKYGLRVKPEMIDLVKNALPATSANIVKITGLKMHYVMATLDSLIESNKIKRGRNFVYQSKRKPYKKRTQKSPIQKELNQEIPQITDIPPEVCTDDVLNNEITKLVSTYYGDITFKKSAITELSQFLNEIQVVKTNSLKQAFKTILTKYDQAKIARPYIEYFIKSGKLKKSGWGEYRIVEGL
jgi:hypothetical protein